MTKEEKASESEQASTSDLVQPTMENSLFSEFFNQEEAQALTEVKDAFEKGICEGRETNKSADCYDFHSWILRSDLLQQTPITKNFPFKGDFALDSTLVSEKLSEVWTNKCGFQTDKGTLNYFCLDASKKVMKYLTKLGESNVVINSYAENYAKNKTVTPQDIQAFVMNGPEELDFSNYDHQIFHLLVCLSLNEEMNAMRRINQN